MFLFVCLFFGMVTKTWLSACFACWPESSQYSQDAICLISKEHAMLACIHFGAHCHNHTAINATSVIPDISSSASLQVQHYSRTLQIHILYISRQTVNVLPLEQEYERPVTSSQMRYHCLDITFPASCNCVTQTHVLVSARRETVQFYSLCSEEIARSPPLPLRVEIRGLNRTEPVPILLKYGLERNPRITRN